MLKTFWSRLGRRLEMERWVLKVLVAAFSAEPEPRRSPQTEPAGRSPPDQLKPDGQLEH